MKLLESKLREFIRKILEQEFGDNKEKDASETSPPEDEEKGAELNIDIEDNPYDDSANPKRKY